MKRFGIAAGIGIAAAAVLFLLSSGPRRALPPTGSSAPPAGEEEPGAGVRSAEAPGAASSSRIRWPVRATWVWDARIVLTPESRSSLLGFCRRRGLDTLYLFAYDLRPPLDRHYRQFNRQAHEAGIAVHALAGDPRWGKGQYHHIPLQWVEAVREFNSRGTPEERFDGIHTDIEVYLLSKSWRERPEALLGGFLDLNARIAERLKGDGDPSPLHFGADIPFWFDDDTSYRILWRGQVKPPSQHVLDTADSVTVLAYRNFAAGSDGTLHLISLELDYADRIGKRVVVGQETQEGLYPSYVTFGGTSCEALRREVQAIEQTAGRRPSFGGLAFHHYESYRKLCGE